MIGRHWLCLSIATITGCPATVVAPDSRSPSADGVAAAVETPKDPQRPNPQPTSSCTNARWIVPPGASIDVDGAIGSGEWDDARPYPLAPTPDWTPVVKMKHDGQSLLVLFSQFQPPSRPPAVVFPEILLDIGNDKAASLEADDWWFHVSFTDCAATGRYDDYDGCVPQAEGWEANNFSRGPLLNLIEMRIDFATLQIDATEAQDLGLLLRLSDTQGYASHWPADADPDRPATWATTRVCLQSNDMPPP